MAQEARERAENVSLGEEAERQKLALACKRAAIEGQLVALWTEFSAEEAALARIFSQDKSGSW